MWTWALLMVALPQLCPNEVVGSSSRDRPDHWEVTGAYISFLHHQLMSPSVSHFALCSSKVQLCGVAAGTWMKRPRWQPLAELSDGHPLVQRPSRGALSGTFLAHTGQTTPLECV